MELRTGDNWAELELEDKEKTGSEQSKRKNLRRVAEGLPEVFS